MDTVTRGPPEEMQTLPTPPPWPEAMAPSYSYQLRDSNSPIDGNGSLVEYQYIKGSSLEETPASSPSGSDGSTEEAQNSIVKEDAAVLDSATSPTTVKSENLDSSDEDEAPKDVKMPQRKGGMQLWQFLYTLLTDPDKKYKELIEWISNSKSREFRLLEPEAIAIWWGEHKNKRSMSYDKLSRELRYYYDKGIIRKVSGERYVYQFCLNPELMYQHIGNSKCRPRLKPMPIAAKYATSKYQMQHSQYEVPMSDPIFIAQGPVALGSLGGQLPSYLHHHPSELGYMAPPPLPLEIQQQMMAEQQMTLGMPQMAGFGHHHVEDSAEPLSVGCNSFSSFPYSTPEQRMSYDQLYALSASSAPPLVETIPYDHSPSLSPATTSSGSTEEAQNSIVKEDAAVLDSATSPKSENLDSSDEDEAPKDVKMPQRKGGMQLWQFLYTLLTDPDKKYKELIEWTSNSKSREFRLLEPEAIAIWWGEHKNKRSMSYDKLSRSLRYYYHKGIIREVSGERYVYQFCNPELMYQHIGNSKCRPRLKPMPIAAKHATSKYQMQHSQYEVPMSDPIFIAQGPVALGSLGGQLPSYLHHHPSELGYMAPPQLPLEIQQQMMAEQQMMLISNT